MNFNFTKKQFIITAVSMATLLGFATNAQADGEFNSEYQAETAQVEEGYQEDLARKNLPKVPVNLKPLPVKHPGNSPFKDINNNMFKNYINWNYSRGITTGYTPTTYNPDAKVTRGEMAVFLHRLAGAPAYTPPFNVYTDVNQYKNQILWLTAVNVTNGTAPYYNPNGKVTRGQMAAFLHRMAKESGNAPKNGKYSSPFNDIQNNMFKNDIGWLRAKGITTGYSPTKFGPNNDITRGEMAAFINRFYNVVHNNGGGSVTPPPTTPPTTTFTGWVKNKEGQIIWQKGGFPTLEAASRAAAQWGNEHPWESWSYGAY